jgi:hypothetical protein
MKAVIEYLEVKKPASISIVSLIVREHHQSPNKNHTMHLLLTMNGLLVWGWIQKKVYIEI